MWSDQMQQLEMTNTVHGFGISGIEIQIFEIQLVDTWKQCAQSIMLMA